jgi:lipopolysaccharide transport protein LptA
MDGSLRKLALLAAAIALHGPAFGQDSGEPTPTERDIELEFASLSIDGQTSRVHIIEPKITQGELSIQAGEALASETGFERAEWELSGGVRIETGSAIIEADTAVFTFADFRLTRSELKGNPARFTDRGAAGRAPATGSAITISYDDAGHVLRMLGDARIARAEYELASCDLIYDFEDKGRITTGSTDCPERGDFRSIPRSSRGATPDSTP